MTFVDVEWIETRLKINDGITMTLQYLHEFHPFHIACICNEGRFVRSQDQVESIIDATGILQLF